VTQAVDEPCCRVHHRLESTKKIGWSATTKVAFPQSRFQWRRQRGERGELPLLWVDVQKLCNMYVMNVRKDRQTANPLKSYRTKPYKFPMHCSKCVRPNRPIPHSPPCYKILAAPLPASTVPTTFRQRLKTFLFRASFPDIIIDPRQSPYTFSGSSSDFSTWTAVEIHDRSIGWSRCQTIVSLPQRNGQFWGHLPARCEV